MAIRLFTTLTLTAMLAAPAAATLDPARMFLTTAFNLSSAEVERIDRGEVVSRTLETKNHRRWRRSASSVSRRPRRGTSSGSPTLPHSSARMTSCKSAHSATCRGRGYRLADHRRLRTEATAAVRSRGLRRAAVGRSDRAHPARRELAGADASRTASAFVRQMLVDYVANYRQNGTPATMEYADRAPRLNVGREFESLIDADTVTSNYAPRLREYLLKSTEVLSREDVGLRLLVEGIDPWPSSHQRDARRDCGGDRRFARAPTRLGPSRFMRCTITTRRLDSHSSCPIVRRHRPQPTSST